MLDENGEEIEEANQNDEVDLFAEFADMDDSDSYYDDEE